jgi:hypothetical protein
MQITVVTEAFCVAINSNTPPPRATRISASSMKLQMSKGGEEPPLTAFFDRMSKTGVNNKSIKRNALVVTKYDILDLGIFADQTYELQSIYLQGENKEEMESGGGFETSIIEKIELAELDLGGNNVPLEGRGSGYTLYIQLYNSRYHDNAVIVTPDEVGLVSMKDEVLDSVLSALPILSFWLGTCYVFATKYNEKYGGSFVDAFFGR